MRAPRLALLGLLALAAGCAVTPTHVYDLMDAREDDEVEAAIDEACRLIRSRRVHGSVRQAAARTLGRLRDDDPRVVEALSLAAGPSQDPALRRQAAWALGELRSPAALAALTDTLRTDLDDETGGYVLEGVAKHYTLMARDEDTLVRVVEAMVYFAGNRQRDVPAIYDLLGARTRTVGVNVRVLHNAIRRLEAAPDPATRAALYNACLELLAKLAERREEILAGPAAWSPRVDAAVDAAREAMRADADDTALLVLWYLGRLAKDPELARPAARVLVGQAVEEAQRPTRQSRAAARLVALWALARMQVHALGPRRALLVDILSREIDPEVIRLFGDLAPAEDAQDVLQIVAPPGGGS